MAKSTKPTPPPYRLGEMEDEAYVGGMAYCVASARGQLLLEHCTKGRRPKSLATCLFVIRACNSHDDLVAALDAANVALRQTRYYADKEHFRAEVEGILAKANGEHDAR